MTKLILAIVVCALLVEINGPVFGDITESFGDNISKWGDAISGTIDSIQGNILCVRQNADSFKECLKKMDKYGEKVQKIEENETKDYCCAYHETKMCIEQLANKNCATEASKVINQLVGKFTANVMPDDCEKYDSFLTCADQTVLIAGGVVAGILVLVIVGCLFCCLKRMCC